MAETAPGTAGRTALRLLPATLAHPDARLLNGRLQAFYRERYGDGDITPMDPTEFTAPRGYFVLGYLPLPDGPDLPVACGGWRAREGGADDPELRPGDAEIKRMFVDGAARGRGVARALLAELERTAAAAGRRRMVLETGTVQPEAIALYTACGYRPIPLFGVYRDTAESRCFGKPLER